MPQKGLNPKQKAFVREYQKDFNGKRAAIRAGYTPRSAEVTASKLLRNAKVAEALAKGQERAAKRAELKVDDLVQMYREVAEFDVTTVVRWNERGEAIFARFEDVPEEARRCISEISQGEDKFGRPILKIKFHSAMEARKLLGQHLGMNRQVLDMPDVERAATAWERAQKLLAAKRKREGNGDGATQEGSKRGT